MSRRDDVSAYESVREQEQLLFFIGRHPTLLFLPPSVTNRLRRFRDFLPHSRAARELAEKRNKC